MRAEALEAPDGVAGGDEGLEAVSAAGRGCVVRGWWGGFGGWWGVGWWWLLLLLPGRELLVGAPAALALGLGAFLLAVDLEGAEAAGLFLLGGEDAARGAALGAVQLALEVEGLAGPDGVDGTALARPVAEVLGVGGELFGEGVEFDEGFGCGGGGLG